MIKSKKILSVMAVLAVLSIPVTALNMRAYAYRDQAIWAECTPYDIAVRSIEGTIVIPAQLSEVYVRCYDWSLDWGTKECISYYVDVNGRTYIPYSSNDYTDAVTNNYSIQNYKGCAFDQEG